jgi:2-keto-4-pentenoate hydratase/2-oxohepta-3-ene-1,7-dioic acid hydratase in catechol pathway
MKLVTFHAPNGPRRSGALVDGDRTIVDLQTAHQARWGQEDHAIASVLAIIEGGKDALDRVHETVKTASPESTLDRSAVRLMAPVPQPPQMWDFLCFEKHLQQAFTAARRVRAKDAPDPEAAMRELEAKGILVVPQAWYERPLYYHPNRLNVIGPEEDVHWPAYSQLMDFELEFGCYIGNAGKNITKEKAREHIFGYTIFNDFSARDEQTKEMPGQLGPGKGKDFDGSNAMGPCVVTADEIDPYRLTMIARVNGEEWGRGNSRDMGWTFEDCIAHVSRGETIVPGDFFGSGTVGNGCGLEHMRFLKSGDVVELEIERIGILRNRVLRD